MISSQPSLQRFALASHRVVFPEGVRPAIVVVDGERIADIVDIPNDVHSEENVRAALANTEADRLLKDLPLELLPDLVIAPGLVDAHVHINEPGHSDWEGFETATMAAAAGGVTTLLDMPLNSIPVTTTPAALDRKRQAASGKCWVDVGFYGGIVPGNADSIDELLRAGVFGIKAFLCHSGLDEFPNATIEDLYRAAPGLKRSGRPLLVHAELTNSSAPRPLSTRHYDDYLASRPPKWEADAIDTIIDYCRNTRCRVHIVHLANADMLPVIQREKAEGLPITVETCPHYLHFLPAEVPEGATQFKCAPPFREPSHRDRLWDGLIRGTIDTIGSDHSPCPPEMKQLQTGDFMSAWGGIASLQLTLPVTWTGALQHSMAIEKLFTRLSTAPASLFGLETRKGQIAIGNDADLVAWSPDTSWTVQASQLLHRHKLSPYEGATLFGKVSRTYLRGQLVFSEQKICGGPSGQLLAA